MENRFISLLKSIDSWEKINKNNRIIYKTQYKGKQIYLEKMQNDWFRCTVNDFIISGSVISQEALKNIFGYLSDPQQKYGWIYNDHKTYIKRSKDTIESLLSESFTNG